LAENCDFLYLPAFDVPVRGPRRNIANRSLPFDTEKLEWWGYTTAKKFDDIFSRFGRIPTCDGQTDGRTDRHLVSLSCGANVNEVVTDVTIQYSVVSLIEF